MVVIKGRTNPPEIWSSEGPERVRVRVSCISYCLADTTENIHLWHSLEYGREAISDN